METRLTETLFSGSGESSAGAIAVGGPWSGARAAESSDDLQPGRSLRLDYADRWMRSGIEACAAPGFCSTVEADMTAARRRMDEGCRDGERITVTGLMVYAVARALDRYPAMQRLMSHTHRCRPRQIHVAVSVSGGGCDFVAPVVVVKDAARRTPADITADIAALAEVARADQIRLMTQLRRWGWLVPFAWMRRWVMRGILARELWKNPDDAPMFHVSGTGNVESFTPMILLTTGILGVGQMKEKAVVENGETTTGLRATLSCGFDHRVWGGRNANLFLNEIKRTLETL